MARMDEDQLLSVLQAQESDAADFSSSALSKVRVQAMREYFRKPYGTEEDGWSSIVTSDVQDTIEGMLPDLLDIFTSSDQAVVFEPQQEKDVAGAQQATDACNYVFYRRNNGFLVLYTAFKDALLNANCAVMWRREVQRVKTIIPLQDATIEMVAMALSEAGEDAEIESVEPSPPKPAPPMPRPGPQMGPGGPQQGMPMGGPQQPPQGPQGAPMPPAQGMPALPPGQPTPGAAAAAQAAQPAMPGLPALPPGQVPVPLQPAQPPVPTFNVRIAVIEEQVNVRVEAFSPNDLLVARDWTSPLLQDCPYVARNMEVTLSALHQMGFEDVTPEELAGSDDAKTDDTEQAQEGRRFYTKSDSTERVAAEDESLTRGWLRIEYVLIDYDGDGIAERREILRLKERILSNEEVSQVPIATASPVLVPHCWDGMSYAEMVSDIQQMKTELTRQMLNNAYLANNPRKKVLTDANWSPLANIDDLLDSRPGAVLRQRQLEAITIDQTPWIGANIFPVLEYIDGMREQRTGLSKQQQGLDPNTLRPDRTATEIQMTMTAAKQRVRLVARVLAETLLKPIFQGILKLLTEKGMPKIAFRLNGRFVEYDPNEWRDQYDMTVNVGLGTGERQQQHAMLQGILQNQMMIAQSPFGQLLLQPQQIYNTEAKLVENAGFKNVGDFWTNPQGKPLPPQQPPPNPALQVAQVKAQSDAQQSQLQAQVDMQKAQMNAQLEAETNKMKTAHEAALEQMRLQAANQQAVAQLELQRSNDARDAEREQLRARYEAELNTMRLRFDEWKAQLESDTKIAVAQIQAGAQVAVARTPPPEPTTTE